MCIRDRRGGGLAGIVIDRDEEGEGVRVGNCVGKDVDGGGEG